MITDLENQLKAKQAGMIWPLEQATYAATFWKQQFQELELRYRQLDIDFSQYKESGLLPIEIDDGK